MTRRRYWQIALLAGTVGVLAVVLLFPMIRRLPAFHDWKLKFFGRSTVGDRVATYGPSARARLSPYFASADVAYPPERFVLAGFKHERELHVFAAGLSQPLTFIRSYSILAASGELGPKLVEGDRQVPEGIYRIESLNPNSRFHLSLRLNYPNEADRRRGRQDGRQDLGDDIMIHGDAVSIGCLAMGDRVAEELFVLAADSRWEETRVILSPVDFRRHQLPAGFQPPQSWAGDLYSELRRELSRLPSSAR